MHWNFFKLFKYYKFLLIKSVLIRLYEVGSIDPGEDITFAIWYEDDASFDVECNLWCDRRYLEDSTLADGNRDFLMSLISGPRRFRSLELTSSDNNVTADVLDVISTNVYRFKYDFGDRECNGDDDESCHDWRRIRWLGQDPCAFRFVCPQLGDGHTCGDHGIDIAMRSGGDESVCREGLIYGGTLRQHHGATIAAWKHQGRACLNWN